MEHLKNKAIITEYLKEFATLPITEEKFNRYISERDAELRRHVEVFQAAIPGYIMEPVDILAEGDKVVVRFIFKGQHTGELMGIPPTGHHLQFTGIIIYQMEDGKIVNHWLEFDFQTFMQQLQPVPVLVEVGTSAN